MSYRNMLLSEISALVGVDLIGKDSRINSLNLANRELFGNNLTYIGAPNYIKHLDNVKISGALLTKESYDVIPECLKNEKGFFIVEEPEREFYDLHHRLYTSTDFYKSSDEESASKVIGSNVFIHPTSFIENGVVIGNNVTIGPKVVIHKGTSIGNNVTVNAGAVIGSQGFQVLYNGSKPYLVQHVGGVKIGNDVSIGANTCIANSLFDGATEVGDGTKIDDLVFIAHNCKIGSNCVITPGVVMTGSSVLHDNVWMAPNSVVLNKINVGSHSLVGSSSLVTKNVESNSKVFGLPAKRIGRNPTK